MIVIFCAMMAFVVLACQKSTTAPSATGVADLTVVDVIPNNVGVIPVMNTTQAIMWFASANTIYFPGFYQYSPLAGNDTVSVLQCTDTLDIGPKTTGQMFYGILPLKKGGIYSLFLCGSDTSSPDYLFTTDTLPYNSPADSVMGIRFVNLSTGSNPMSINLESSPIGSEAGNLPYKGITGFKQYISNSSISDYLFVVRDAATGDSLTQFDFRAGGGSFNNGYGLTDPNNGNLLTFKNVTIAIYGSEAVGSTVPLSAMLIDNY
jgi:hypothetical protein